MNKWLRICCIALAFTLSGFYVYKTTVEIHRVDVICACLWFVTGIINCMTLFEDGRSDGAKIAHLILDDIKERIDKEIEVLEESEEDDGLE